MRLLADARLDIRSSVLLGMDREYVSQSQKMHCVLGLGSKETDNRF